MVAGRNVTPKDEQATEKLKRYWTEGEGAGKIGWGSGGDWYRCVTEVTKAVKGKMSPEDVKGYCENLHQRATGMTTAEHTKLLNAGKSKKKP
jgi:hypothetical protein